MINHYSFYHTHRVCIYIKPSLFHFLVMQSRNDFNEFITYLLNKYIMWVFYYKNSEKLRRGVTCYQPNTKEYKRVVLNKISPELWTRLKEIKFQTGFSLSFLIRIMLEWEMLEKGNDILPVFSPALLTFPQTISYNNFGSLNNYVSFKQWDTRNNRILTVFSGFS